MKRPELKDYFIKGTALGFFKRRHPYDFIETYQLLRSVYNYRSYYVNLGLWKEDLVVNSQDLDPAERLVKFLCQKSGLTAPEKVLDVGSGLGQSAVHYVEWLKARNVTGLNLNERQIAFANALATSHGLEKEIKHKNIDACSGFETVLGESTFDGIFAVECIGHFKRPELFFKSVAATLKPGGVFVCCLNVAKNDLSFMLKTMFKATYGFVPQSQRFWNETIQNAGLTFVDKGDITEAVLGIGTKSVLKRLDERDLTSALPKLMVPFVKKQLSLVEAGVKAGELGYVWMVVRKN